MPCILPLPGGSPSQPRTQTRPYAKRPGTDWRGRPYCFTRSANPSRIRDSRNRLTVATAPPARTM